MISSLLFTAVNNGVCPTMDNRQQVIRCTITTLGGLMEIDDPIDPFLTDASHLVEIASSHCVQQLSNLC